MATRSSRIRALLSLARLRPSSPRALALGAARLAEPRACAIGGGLLGLLGGPFGMLAGILIGAMLDIARLETRERGRIAAFLRAPYDARPAALAAAGTQGGGAAEWAAAPAYAAAACLALRGEWPGPSDPEARRALWSRFSSGAPPPPSRVRRAAERAVDVAAREAAADLPALARFLATGEAARERLLLADWAFALAALGSLSLDARDELRLRAALGDCGLGAADLAAARSRAFPSGRDPWSVLGLAPGAPRAELKRAYRRLSRAFHPDAAPADDGARFREISAAYAELSALAGR